MTREPLVTGDLVTFFTEPITVAPGDSLRGARCLFCGQRAADTVIRVVTVTNCQLDNYRPRALISRAYVVHEEHFPLADGEAHHAAHVLENPGCTCRAHG